MKAGDTLVLHLQDGRRVEITAARLEDEAFVSAEGVPYPYSDIAQIQRRSFRAVRTTSLVAGVVLGALVVAAARAASALGSIMGGG